MSHTLTAGLRQALLSRGFLIAFTGVIVVQPVRTVGTD